MKKHFAAACLAYGIEDMEGQPYNPTSQSRVERLHRTFNSSFAKARAEGSKASAAVVLARVAHEINVAPSELTDELSPHRLMFGVVPAIPYIRFFDPRLVGLSESSPFVTLRDQTRELVLTHAALAATREEDRAARRSKHESAVARRLGDAVTLEVGDAVWAKLPPHGVGNKLERHLAWCGPWEVVSFDTVTGKTELVYRSDADVPFRASVHVRNTRLFSAVRPVDPPFLLDDKVFPLGWESHSVPLGGMSSLPKSVQDGLDEATEAAAKQAALAEDRRRREEEKEQKERQKQLAREQQLAEEAAREQRESLRERKSVDAKASRRAENEATLIQHKIEEVLEIDAGKRKVLVRRKNGDEVWMQIDDEDVLLKSLLRKFSAVKRQQRSDSKAKSDLVAEEESEDD